MLIINLTDFKTRYYCSTLKLKNSPSKGEKKYASFNNSHNNYHRITRTGYFYKYTCSDFLLIFASFGINACHEYYYFASLGCLMHQGCRTQRLTKSLHIFCMDKRLYEDFVLECNQCKCRMSFIACGCRLSRSYTVYSWFSEGWLLGIWAYQTMQWFPRVTTKQ